MQAGIIGVPLSPLRGLLGWSLRPLRIRALSSDYCWCWWLTQMDSICLMQPATLLAEEGGSLFRSQPQSHML